LQAREEARDAAMWNLVNNFEGEGNLAPVALDVPISMSDRQHRTLDYRLDRDGHNVMQTLEGRGEYDPMGMMFLAGESLSPIPLSQDLLVLAAGPSLTRSDAPFSFGYTDGGAATGTARARPDPTVIDGYSSDKAGWHEYKVQNLICSAEMACTREEIIDQLSRFAVPGQDPSKPVVNNNIYSASDPRSILGQQLGGSVITNISSDGLTIRNTTLPFPAHIFSDGVIVRTATQSSDGAWYITTHGYGNNVIPGAATINEIQGPKIFNFVDEQMRRNIEAHRGK